MLKIRMSSAIWIWASNFPRSRYSILASLSCSSSASSISEASSCSTSLRRPKTENVLSKTFWFKAAFSLSLAIRPSRIPPGSSMVVMLLMFYVWFLSFRFRKSGLVRRENAPHAPYMRRICCPAVTSESLERRLMPHRLPSRMPYICEMPCIVSPSLATWMSFPFWLRLFLARI